MINRKAAMNIPRLITGLSLGLICFAVGLTYMRRNRDACVRLIRLTEKVDRLSVRPRPYHVSDHIVGVLHQSDPFMYYEKEAEKEKKVLLASGQLVEIRVPYAADGIRSDREIAKALLAVRRRTGADYWIDFDLTNRLMLVACRPRDVAAFSPALK
jgi:hypothetical protein